jgi:uncharacterized protein YbjT (DUF2867 family)
MKVILFGASGMVGQGVLRECLLDSEVEAVLTVGRNPLTAEQAWPALGSKARAKLRQIVQKDLTDYSKTESELSGYDACFFCLGVSSAGMTEEAYRRVTYDVTLAAAETLVRLNPGMTFIYVSGAGTDSSEKGRSMWARVKGQTENALLKLPFRSPPGGAYMFRPGAIVALHGIVSRTRLYRVLYVFVAPLTPFLLRLFPHSITTTEQIGRAMLRVARQGYPKHILEPVDITSF